MINQIKTTMLLGVLTAVLLWIGSFWGKSGLIIGLVFAAAMNFGSYWFSDKIVLRMYRAREMGKNHLAYKLVKELSQKAGLPMPKVYLIPSDQPNAFATGRNPEHAAVAFTEGILQMLDKKELEGVIAHELAHVKNRDILISSIAGTIAGVISYVATMAQWAAIFGGVGGRDNEGGGSILQFLVLIIVAPLVATIVRMAISRSREFLADETGARIIKKSDGLSSALRKLESYSKRIPMRLGNQATEHMFIVNPFSGRSFGKLFSTHPPTSERVEKLKEIRF